jgi:hypothetical protein
MKDSAWKDGTRVRRKGVGGGMATVRQAPVDDLAYKLAFGTTVWLEFDSDRGVIRADDENKYELIEEEKMTGIATRLGTLIEIDNIEQLRQLPEGTLYQSPTHTLPNVWLAWEDWEDSEYAPGRWRSMQQYDGEDIDEALPFPGLAWMPAKEKADG